ncbi:MAG TPA: VOC family protein [Candidatus Polarisedimenticolaceae bacterium]|nr:VOC family protein [Candidatus Polarisedimenticolaceae bacterium]
MRKKAKAKKTSKSKAPAKKKVTPIPPGFGTVTPHLVVDGAARAIELYQKAFGAKLKSKMAAPGGTRLAHAELQIGSSRIMLADDFPEWQGGKPRSPGALGASSVTIHLYVPNADATFKRAQEAGMTVSMPISDMFWGDRYGQLKDPFGHVWSIASRRTVLTPRQMEKAAVAAMSAM